MFKRLLTCILFLLTPAVGWCGSVPTLSRSVVVEVEGNTYGTYAEGFTLTPSERYAVVTLASTGNVLADELYGRLAMQAEPDTYTASGNYMTLPPDVPTEIWHSGSAQTYYFGLTDTTCDAPGRRFECVIYKLPW